MSPIRVLLISSVVPDEAAMGGPLILKRHFENPELECRVFLPSEKRKGGALYEKLKHGSLRSLLRLSESLCPPMLDDGEIDISVDEFQPDLILSVAHGWQFLSAARTARRHGLPFILWCQDWWPDFPQVAPIARKSVRRRLLKVCHEASQIICVSNGMYREIGAPPNAQVLHDLPSTVSAAIRHPELTTPYRIVYGGNIGEYGPMVGAAAAECIRGGQARIDVFGGPRPGWNGEIASVLRRANAFHGLFRSRAFLKRIEGSHAVLVTQPFTKKAERRMRTCFPSKLIEMLQLQKPLIIWGPEYSSAIEWARDKNVALCITDPDPICFRKTVESLASSPDEHRRLVRASAEAAKLYFDPVKIREEFVKILRNAMEASLRDTMT